MGHRCVWSWALKFEALAVMTWGSLSQMAAFRIAETGP